MHDEWLCRAAPQRNLSQEMRHLGPAPCVGSASQCLCLSQQMHKGDPKNHKMLQQPRSTAVF